VIRRLTLQGITPAAASLIWKEIGGLLDDWRDGPPKQDRIVRFYFDYRGLPVVTVEPEATFAIARPETKKGREHEIDWTDVQSVFRFDHFVTYVIACLQVVIDDRALRRSTDPFL
jgi:hypothetical protein